MAFTGDGKNFSNTFSMSLPRPTPGVCGALGREPPGASWLELLNQSLSILDGHNHAGPGYGVQIPSAGIGINADLSFAGFNATSLRSTRYTPQALTSITASDVGCLLVSGADLYYVDTAGNQVRLTSAGGIAGTPGSISGLASPAAVTYTPVSKLFAFTSSSGVAANLSAGPISIGDATVSGGKAATIGVPAGLAANYSLTLPSALPASTSLLSLSNAGAISVVTYPLVAASIAAGTLTTSQISASAGILGSQLAAAAGITGSQLSASAGILGSQLSASAGILGSQLSASAGIVGSQLAANTVARTQLAAVGQQLSGGSGSVGLTSTTPATILNQSVTLTTSGRPVVLMVVPQSNNTMSITTAGSGIIQVLRTGNPVPIGKWVINAAPLGALICVDTQVVGSPGTYTWSTQGAGDGTNQMQVNNISLLAYEL